MTSEPRVQPTGPSTAAERRPVVGTDAAIEMRPHNCFACGQLNTHGLQLALHLGPDLCWTELRLGSEFEGWEGIAHGGILATILDEVMAWSLVQRDRWGVTARMTVDFRKPVPVGLPIRAEGRVTETRRRLIRTSGRIVEVATGLELAAADGLYVAAPEERARQLKERYGFRLVRPDGKPQA